jgi:exodeoxyribonuclease VII large subunit
MELEGLGALQAAFEKLKRKLQAEGLFAPERKRALPKYPARLGIVTSATGAAIRDILHVIRRRCAALEIVLASCRVQGEGSASEIACAIGLLNEWNATDDPAKRIDLILVARGGGSLEDLWAFNEEVLARAVFNSQIPIISGVGHEIDFTICDFVADFRAATPSAAAEIITEALYASREFIVEARANLRRMIEAELEARRDRVQQTHHRLQRCHPTRRLREYAQRVDEAQTKLARCAKTGLRNARQKWLTANHRFLRLRPSQALKIRRELVSQLQLEISRLMRLKLDLAKRRLEGNAAKLRLLSPLNVLERGYSITVDASSGKVIRDADEVHPGQTMETQLKKGKVRSVVE